MTKSEILAIIMLLALSISLAQWDMVDMGTGGGWMRGLVVGPVKPDSRVSVFAANMDGNLYEFLWEDSVWSMTNIATFYYSVERMCIGNVKGERYNQLYVACGDTHIYEFMWNPDELCWDQNRIETPHRWNADVVIGNGRNDGIERLYLGTEDYVYEYTWDDTGWVIEYVGSTDTTYGEWIENLELGTGKNDDTIRIYVSCQNDPDRYGVWEFTWNGTEWVREPVANMEGHHEIYALAVGEGRNDGITRIYAGGNQQKLFEYTWNGTEWDSILVHEGESKWSIAIGNGRNDYPPHYRVYQACHDGYVYEHTWEGDSWNTVAIGVGIGWGLDNNMWGLDIGNGRNDGIIRVYAGNYDRHVYEFSFSASIFETAPKPDCFHISAYPNPFNSSCEITVQEDAEVEIYDLRGNVVTPIPTSRTDADHSAEVSGGSASSRGIFIWTPNETIPSGIYLIKAKTQSGQIFTKRIILIK